MRRAATRAAVAAAFGTFVILGGAASASADGSPLLSGQPTAADLQNAHSVAASATTRDQLANVQFTSTEPGTGDSSPAVSVSEKTIPVFELTADFVRGTTGAPAGDLAYVAVPAQAGDGTQVTIGMTREGDSWRVDDIATGLDEQTAASMLPQGTSLLHEPQIDAWYAVSDKEIRLLNTSGSDTAPTVYSLEGYQRLVASRYGDKLPGSDYDKEGLVGGFGSGGAGAVSQSATGSETGSATGPDFHAVPLGIGVMLAACALALAIRGFRRQWR
ncbi:hypothetical protein N5079_01910 [Planotetraspora sp. A-T 1434]|uniref:hypothetical protein n=1 Tax=Planotetraspora sp. A-T 1434 TaxID=2979219 RepID=UPI0021C1E996|nr:hypothetical protein [Planotetraspora sp. A-T 1434]MCT9928967.1 hypothetical protein [Planotetraspora sp. A-T 1434]